MIYPLVDELATRGIPVVRTCAVLGIARQPFYRWRKHPHSHAQLRRANLVRQARRIHEANPTWGYRLIADELHANGLSVSVRTVWSICHEAGIMSNTHPAKPVTKSARKNSPVAEDKIQRCFHAPAPNRVWLTDITEHSTREGKLYTCAIKDVWSNRIVGLACSASMSTSLVLEALSEAVKKRQPQAGCIVHSDRGSQFTSTAYQNALKAAGLVQSMGQVGSCADNAAMESFFSLLQKNVLNQQHWHSRNQLQTAIRHWIEAQYHRRRRQARLGKLTPIEYETIYQPTT